MTRFDYCYYYFWVYFIHFISYFYFRLRYHYTEPIPKTGKLVVIANHQSFLDPPLIGIGMPRSCNYMARETLFRGLLGWHISHLNAFPVSQTKNPIAGIKETLKRLKNEEAVLIFPEGSRTEDGKLAEFHKGIISVARRSKAPILPAIIQGAYEAFPRHSIFPKPHRVSVTYGHLISVEEIQKMSEDELLVYLRNTILGMLGETEEPSAALTTEGTVEGTPEQDETQGTENSSKN